MARSQPMFVIYPAGPLLRSACARPCAAARIFSIGRPLWSQRVKQAEHLFSVHSLTLLLLVL
jgi:hypothetical protein